MSFGVGRGLEGLGLGVGGGGWVGWGEGSLVLGGVSRVKGKGSRVGGLCLHCGGGKVAENVAIVPYFLIILLRAT